ncbi:DUF3465 domain-containing protein [Shewanella salipaludis]|uniref:DUF3465 domain-containing protein n=1 Tax=Shewanella salipaludis TaxID=2723052 RepID=A0A972FYY8_9GAMM|nr:DUF3465 domain-containing protein [Shewanella salipaludis]
MKKLLIILSLVTGIYLWMDAGQSRQPVLVGDMPSTASAVADDGAIERAFENHQSQLQVEGMGLVVRLLADDTKGARHQRFILRLPSGLTLLIAHNIDLAARINALANGDRVQFYGEYEWNRQGGIVHWTHRDPDGRHVAGWLKHNGRTYQ